MPDVRHRDRALAASVAREVQRLRRAVAAMNEALAEDSLPPVVPGQPARLERMFAALDAPDLLARLARIHGVDRWSRRDFVRAVALDTLAAWKRGGTLSVQDDTVTVTGACPLADRLERDPRVCSMCRALQESLVRAAVPGEVERVGFERAGSRGVTGCITEFRFRPRKGVPSA